MKQLNRNKLWTPLILVAAAALLAAAGCSPPAARKPATGKPNFVFILVDDLGWTDLGCYGSTYYETPNIDRLASEGMRFTDAYAACHSCSPTRASILTGRYPARTHLTDWIPGRTPPGAKLKIPNWTNFLRRAEVTIAEALKPAGYVSASIGKWHLGQRGWWPEDQGFDVSFGGSHIGSHGSMFPPYWSEERRKELDFPGIPDPVPGEYLTDRLTREAEAFLEKNRDRPFFLYLSHYAVHTPIQSKPEVVAKYQAKKPSGHHHNPKYAAMVEGVDDSVGRILAKLAELNLVERTVVVFFSDNGGLSKNGRITSNFPLRGEKSSMWEGGVRVPLIIKWPGVVHPGSVSHEPVISVDFFPTLLTIAGVSPPEGVTLDGVSLVPLLRGETGFHRGPIFWHSPHYNAHTPVITTTPYGAVRDGDFKLIEFYEDNHAELYNLKNDIGETTDLAAQMPGKTRQLRRELHEWRDSVGAQMPTPNPDYDPVKYREYKEKKLWKPVGPYQQHTTFATQ